jgi:hypothetical protein
MSFRASLTDRLRLRHPIVSQSATGSQQMNWQEVGVIPCRMIPMSFQDKVSRGIDSTEQAYIVNVMPDVQVFALDEMDIIDDGAEPRVLRIKSVKNSRRYAQVHHQELNAFLVRTT